MNDVSLHIGTSAQPQAQQDQTKQKAEKKSAKNWMDQINAQLANLSGIKPREKVIFFRLLATMINAGISIVQALKILVDQTENPHMKNIIGDIASKIESGSKFSEALADYEKYFNKSQVGMVEAGEASGRLNETLLQVATEAEKSDSLRSKVKGAMIYPVVVIFLLFAAGFAVMTFVMPRIKEMFESLGSELPAMTMALINASDFMVGRTLGLPNSVIVLLVLFAIGTVFSLWKKTKAGRFLWAEAFMQFPVFGKLAKQIALARFMRTLSTLTSSGVSIVKALEITAESVDNAVYERRIAQIGADVKQGITMGENMKDDEKHFPSMMVGMISVAEQTAQVDQISSRLADFYEEQVDDMVKNLSSLMEPIIIVVLGLAVGFLVIAVMMPILSSSDLAFSAGG